MIIDELRRIVETRATPAASAWFAEQLAVAGDEARLRVAFAGAGRRLGTDAIGDEAAGRITAAGLTWPATAGTDECGRAALLLAAPATPSLARDLLRRGEVRERQAVLRVLAALPQPEALVELAVDACRTNVLTVFEAIACDNDFPARHFDDHAFDQMVLKALFVGAPVARIAGLAERTTAELVRMVDAFASERRAAGRPIPDDVRLIRRTS